jgi:hypothetical protein
MASSGMLRRVTVVITYVSDELSASFMRVAGIGELGGAKFLRNVCSYKRRTA